MSSDLLCAEFTLSSTQIKALGAYVILAAPGSGYLWQVTDVLVGILVGSDAVADPLTANASLYLTAGANALVAAFDAADLASTLSGQKSTAVSLVIDTKAHVENQALKLSYGGAAITGNAAGDARLFLSVTYRCVPF